MANTTLMDEFQLAFYAPRSLRADAYRAIRRTLDGQQFQKALRRAIQGVIDRYPSLAKVRCAITR